MALSIVKRVLLPALLALVGPCVQAYCERNAPPMHGPIDARDRFGLPWYAQPVCHRVEFASRGMTLDSGTRESLAQRVDGARRLYAHAALCAHYGPERPDLADARLDYLRWWLGLQGVPLTWRHMEPVWVERLGLRDGGDSVELQIGRCR